MVSDLQRCGRARTSASRPALEQVADGFYIISADSAGGHVTQLPCPRKCLPRGRLRLRGRLRSSRVGDQRASGLTGAPPARGGSALGMALELRERPSAHVRSRACECLEAGARAITVDAGERVRPRRRTRILRYWSSSMRNETTEVATTFSSKGRAPARRCRDRRRRASRGRGGDCCPISAQDGEDGSTAGGAPIAQPGRRRQLSRGRSRPADSCPGLGSS